jgi:protein involved in polysaccharide export with SLBB domain
LKIAKQKMWKYTDNFKTVFSAERCGRWLSLSGAAVLLLVLNTSSLFAGDPFFTDTPAPPRATNLLHGKPDVLPPASTNVLQAGVTNSGEALDDKYKLAIGDRLSFQIVEDEDEPKELGVTDSGDAQIPYVGRFPCVGKTCRQLSGELKTRLEKDYYYQATVIVAVDYKAKSQGKVYLVGPVEKPGPQDIPSDEEFTLSKAILRAGGFGDFADQHHVRVTRQEPGQGEAANKTYTVDVGKILEKGKTDLDMVLEPGDLIYIPERSIRF